MMEEIEGGTQYYGKSICFLGFYSTCDCVLALIRIVFQKVMKRRIKNYGQGFTTILNICIEITFWGINLLYVAL